MAKTPLGRNLEAIASGRALGFDPAPVLLEAAEVVDLAARSDEVTFTVHQVGHKNRELIRTPFSDVADLFAQAWLRHRLGGALGTTRNILDHHSTDAERAQYDLVVRRNGEFHARFGWRHEQTLGITDDLDEGGGHG